MIKIKRLIRIQSCIKILNTSRTLHFLLYLIIFSQEFALDIGRYTPYSLFYLQVLWENSYDFCSHLCNIMLFKTVICDFTCESRVPTVLVWCGLKQAEYELNTNHVSEQCLSLAENARIQKRAFSASFQTGNSLFKNPSTKVFSTIKHKNGTDLLRIYCSVRYNLFKVRLEK